MRRAGTPSPTWRSFLRNEAIGIAAIDMFVAMSASFRLLYVMIILAHGRRRIVRFDVTQHPTAAWLAQQIVEAFPWETAASFLLSALVVVAAAGVAFSGVPDIVIALPMTPKRTVLMALGRSDTAIWFIMQPVNTMYCVMSAYPISSVNDLSVDPTLSTSAAHVPPRQASMKSS